MKRREFLVAGAGAGLHSIGGPGKSSQPPGQGRQEQAGDRVKIVAFQGKCSNDFDKNLDRVLKLIEKCGKEKVDFLCFPEGYLSNYSADLAVGLDDPRVKKLLRVSGRFDMVSIVGISEIERDTVLNTALALYQGEILGKYRKTMLTGSDKKQFSSEYSLPVFRAKGITFGIIICHDSSFVEPALTMRWKGARLLFSPHYNSIDSDRMDEHRKKVRNNHVGLATLLQMVVVRSNVVGSEEGKLSYGDSTIFSPLGEVVAAAPLFQETLISAEFERNVFEQEKWAARKEVPAEVIQQLCEVAQSRISDSGANG